MLMHPSIHIVITVEQEAIEMLCTTVGFLAVCWVCVKAISLLPKKEPNEPKQPT
jgi:hypothetical protein